MHLKTLHLGFQFNNLEFFISFDVYGYSYAPK